MGRRVKRVVEAEKGREGEEERRRGQLAMSTWREIFHIFLYIF